MLRQFALATATVALAAAALSAVVGLTLAGSLPAHVAEPITPIRVILVGDSTMATRSGYGDALCERFVESVKCVNLARGGRSSGSFRAEQRWDEVEAMLRNSAGFSATYVLIQFGHNDQPGKPGRSTDLANEFPVNMARYAAQAKALGAVPVLVTPLTRRSFKGAYLRDDLAPWADATRKAAAHEHAALLDLNADSAAAVQAMGQDQADTLAMAPRPAAAQVADPNKVEVGGAAKSAFDRTHLGAKGAALFSAMVQAELSAAIPSIKPWFRH
jgi:lysophospholipase L1-like esterase